MEDFKRVIGKVATGATLTQQEARDAFDLLTSGEVKASQIGAFLMALRVRGETVDEIVGAATAMRAKMLPVNTDHHAIDIVGTGGDQSGSFNISTCAAFIVAGAGVRVAKHGNRAISSRCGAADVLGALGVCINLSPKAIAHCISEVGLGFMFAPAHHLALQNVSPTRAELGTRTIFNILGPLINPAAVRRQVVGVYGRQWVEPIAHVLGRLGSLRALVVHGSDGLDEITTTGPTTIASLENGAVRTFEVKPESLGLARMRAEQLKGGDADDNARALRAVLRGDTGPYRDIAALNAAAAFIVAGRAGSLEDGLELALQTISSGEAHRRLERLIVVSNESRNLT
jgi:anthranilate phosphoribosyltransferase